MRYKTLLSTRPWIASGLWLAILSGSAFSQEPKPATASKEPGQTGVSTPARAIAPRASSRPANNDPNAVMTTTSIDGAYSAQPGFQPPNQRLFGTTMVNQFPARYDQPAEMLIYQNGDWKVTTENLNDPKTMEAQRDGAKRMAEAMQTLRSEESDEEKRAEAKKVMTQYLEAHFDHDQKKRRDQVEALEAQVAKLKAQLEKRSQSKNQMIELRLTLLENDSSGLSFPQSWTQLPGSEPNMGYRNEVPLLGNVYYNPPPIPGTAYPVPSAPAGSLPPLENSNLYQPAQPPQPGPGVLAPASEPPRARNAGQGR